MGRHPHLNARQADVLHPLAHLGAELVHPGLKLGVLHPGSDGASLDAGAIGDLPFAPNTFRDVDGDLWAVSDDGRRWLRERHGPWEGPKGWTLDEIIDSYGPLTPLTDDEDATQAVELAELTAKIAAVQDRMKGRS